jgi:lysine 2,3-aminomutase
VTGPQQEQPYQYRSRELVEPDWRRLPVWRDVTPQQWADVQWQRAHCVKNPRQLRAVYGDLLGEEFYADVERDQERRATMSILLPPQMVNTMVPDAVPTTAAMYADPVRRYMLPALSDRDQQWPSHPHATRDSLHEQEMWAVEGLTHRYPTKVLAELLPTCPQYCGHCTRMDLVGNSTPQVAKHKFELRPVDIRLATKALMGLPQHWLSAEVRAGMERLASTARRRGVMLAIHTHVNAAQQVTPLVAEATRAMLEAGVRDIRNQGVLLRGVNADAHALLDLCFALLDGAGIMPYYFYMCDLIPNAEHWRVAVHHAQALQHAIMGYLPGFATPRIVCDVPYVGKRWVHQLEEYDRERGISYWTKNYRTAIEAGDPEALTRAYEYYDPISSLPEAGQAWWRDHATNPQPAADALAAASRTAAAAAQ